MVCLTFHLKLISEIQEKVRFLSPVTVADGGTEGTKYRVIVVGSLYAEQRAVVEEMLQR